MARSIKWDVILTVKGHEYRRAYIGTKAEAEAYANSDEAGQWALTQYVADKVDAAFN